MPKYADEAKRYSRLSTLLSCIMARICYLLAESHRYFGNTYNLKSEQENALQALNYAIALDHHFARAYMERGILYWREIDHPRRAIQDLTRAYELAPDLIEARFNRAIAYQQLREYTEAIEDYQAYLAEGRHPHWREYAQNMIQELAAWIPERQDESFL